MKKIVFQILVLVVLFSSSFHATAQSNDAKQKFIKKEIAAYLKSEMKAEHIPGLSYAVVENGKIIAEGAYGFSNIELQSPVNIHTRFAIASISKTFTATAIMLLAQQGKLSLEDPINKYLDSLPETWKNITIRHLLSHTSGIRDNEADFPAYPIVDVDYKKEYTNAEIIRKAIDAPLNFKPGERWAYCNTGFQFLGFIIEKISGEKLPEFMKENIFAPLDMNETSYFNVSTIIPNRATGYTIDDDDPSHTLKNGHYMGTFFCSMGDCGIITTAGDMAKWSLALDSGKIVGKKCFEQMWTPSKLLSGIDVNFFGSSYGLGWKISDYRGYNVIGHDGSLWNGYTSSFIHFSDLHLTVIVLDNQYSANPDNISYAIAGFCNNALASISRLEPAGNADTSTMQKVNILLREIINDNLDTLLVTTGFKQRMNPVTKLMIGDTAHLPVISYINSDMFGGNKLLRYGIPIKKIDYYKLQFPGGAGYLSLYLTANNKIADWMEY